MSVFLSAEFRWFCFVFRPLSEHGIRHVSGSLASFITLLALIVVVGGAQVSITTYEYVGFSLCT